MKVLVAIDTPQFGRNAGSPRAEQWERTEIANMIRLFASRIEMGQPSGSISGNGGATLHWKTEQSPASAEGEAA